jgi:hypothetical protein
MGEQFQQHEREVDRELADLAPRFDRPSPRPERIAAIKDAIDAEARRLRRRERRIVALRPWIGAAAALLLTVGLSLPVGSRGYQALLAADEDPGVAFGNWMAALAETRERFAALFNDDWYLGAEGSNGEENTDVADSFDSLEESLESFARIMGA